MLFMIRILSKNIPGGSNIQRFQKLLIGKSSFNLSMVGIEKLLLRLLTFRIYILDYFTFITVEENLAKYTFIG